MTRTRPGRRRKPSFFKVLIGDYVNQLQIPPAFYKHFDEKGPQRSRLQTLANKWHVNVEKIDGGFFFQKGWKKFVHGNGLKLGEFLVFRYVGNSKFFVDIYGRSTCKKDIVKVVKTEKEGQGNEDDQGLKAATEGTGTGQGMNSKPIEEEVTDTDEFERSLDPWTRINTGKDVPVERANTSTVKDGERQPNHDEDGDGDDPTRIPNDLRPCPETEKSPLGPQLIKGRRSSSSFKNAGKNIALQKANAFKSASHSFVVPMHYSYVHAGYVNVPCAFAKNHLTKQISDVTLRVNENTWSVNFQHERKMKRLTTGWPDFVRANKLEVGNACVFVLSNEEKCIFDVIVYRTD